MDQQEQTDSPVTEPFNDSFKVIPESWPKMTKHVKRCYINVCHNIMELDITETKDFSVLNWVAGLVSGDLANEIVTVISLDNKGKILCMLRFLNLALLDHETTFSTDNVQQPLKHTVHLKFEVIERVNNTTVTGG